MTANERQVGGDHYKTAIQHWDFAASNNFDYFQGQITKYVTRWKQKNGLEDLEKALHFLQKYIEVQKGSFTILPASRDHPRPFGYDPMVEQYEAAPKLDCKHPLAGVLQNQSREDD